jgi:Fe-S cluster biogenesis protein NfuA
MTVPPPDPSATGERVDRLLEQLRAAPDPRVAGVAEELVRSLVQLYGAGLERIVELLGQQSTRELCADPLVESLLLVHDLHPLDRDTRIRRALDRLGSRSIELDFLGVDAQGVVHVRLTGGGRGCGASSAVTEAIATAIADAAPETSGVDVETAPAPQPLLQISLRPGLRGV